MAAAPALKRGRRGRPAAPRVARAAPGSAWLARRWPLALALLFLAAWGWREAYLARLAGTPLAAVPAADEGLYAAWAETLVRTGLRGGNPYFLAPLYPYVLAILRLAGLPSVPAALHVQALWGAGAAVLLADAARRLTRPAVGLAIGAVAAFHAGAVFFDGLVLGESLLFALAAALLWAVAAWRGELARPARALAAGALIGVLAQGRATSAVLVALVPLALPAGTPLARRARSLGIALAGLALVCAPAAVHNARTAHAFVPFTYSGGFNLCVGNNPLAQGTFVSITGTHESVEPLGRAPDGGVALDGRGYVRERTGRDLDAAANDRWWRDRALEYLRAEPGHCLALAARKLAMAWSRFDYPQIEDRAEFAALAGPLGLPSRATDVAIAVLALAGLALAWRQGGGARFAAGATVLLSLALAPFFVTDRYRHGLLAAELLCAAVALEHAIAFRPRARAATALLPGALAGLVLASLPLPHLDESRAAWGTATDLGMRYLLGGRADQALPWFERAVAFERDGRVRWTDAEADRVQRALLYHGYARALAGVGRADEAAAARAFAHRLAPSALEPEEPAAPAGTTPAGAAYARGVNAARGGDLAGAAAAFRDATAADPRAWDAWGALVRVLVQSGRAAEAQAAHAAAVRAGWRGTACEAHRALVLYALGRTGEARDALRALPRAELEADPALAQIARAIER